MTTSEFRQILEKWEKRECSHEEERLLLSMFNDSEQETKALMLAELEAIAFEDKDNDVDFDALLQQIKHKIRQKPHTIENTRHLVIKLARVAAILVLAIVTGGILSYILFSAHASKQVSVFQIKAPYGSRSELTLPDGSTVWLNAGSNIQYDDGFNKQNRNLYLEGEGYFKVAKNKHLPFIVKTTAIHIKAIGTEFNVKAYANDNTIETTLIEGKITLENENKPGGKRKEIYLEPYQKAVYVKNSKKMDITSLKKLTASQDLKPVSTESDMFISKKIDPLPDIAWKENKLIFKRAELENMAVTLERKYNIAIYFESEEVKKFRFTGTLEDETLQQVLDVIKLTAPIDYSLKGKEVTIHENAAAQKEFIKHLRKK
jgi:transmembrane sensor